MAAKITVFDNGPSKVEGEFELLDMNGKPLGEPNKPIYLCRCGHTKNAPFCDGSHKKEGFSSSVQVK